jgi:hypothetical protein
MDVRGRKRKNTEDKMSKTLDKSSPFTCYYPNKLILDIFSSSVFLPSRFFTFL